MGRIQPYKTVYYPLVADGTRVEALPTGQLFHRSRARKRLIMGPFGSGKSVIMTQEIMRQAQRQTPNSDGIRKSRYAIVRNTYPQLSDTTIKTWVDWMPEKKYGRMKHAPPPEHHLVWEVEGRTGDVTRVECEILFRALDRPDQVANLLSLELSGAWINEIREVPRPIFDALDGRIGRYPSVRDGGCLFPFIIADTNPYDIDHWLYDLFEVQQLPGFEFWSQPGKENTANLPKDYYYNISQGKDPEWVRMYVNGLHGFICDGLPVYPEFLHSSHVSNERLDPIKGKPIVVGIDFGLTPAAIYTQLTPRGQWIILGEQVSDGMGIERFAEVQMLPYQNERFKDFEFQFFADPAGTARAQTDEKTCFDILAQKGILCEEGAIDFTARREGVAAPLNRMIDGKPGMLIDGGNCKVLVKGFMGGYHYREIANSGKFNPKPEKNLYSHPHDALQYAGNGIFSFSRRGRKKSKRHNRPTWKTV